MDLKRCGTCKRLKPIGDYCRHKGQPDGLQPYCKPCQHEAQRRSRLNNKDAIKARQRSYQERHGAEQTARKAAWRRANPEKTQAHQAVYRALRSGRLTRPDSCDACGQTELPIQAHHADYTAWLEVEWLCGSCHALRHLADRTAA